MIHERNNFKMGTVEMLVLSLLSQKDLYGYEISLLLKDLSEGSYVVPEGSLYPVLYKLEDKKLITSHAIQTGKRRVRKYYHIEATGLERLDQLLSDYRVIADSIESILSAKLSDDNPGAKMKDKESFSRTITIACSSKGKIS